MWVILNCLLSHSHEFTTAGFTATKRGNVRAAEMCSDPDANWNPQTDSPPWDLFRRQKIFGLSQVLL